jgi:GATA-binding protein, other eukaryote
MSSAQFPASSLTINMMPSATSNPAAVSSLSAQAPASKSAQVSATGVAPSSNAATNEQPTASTTDHGASANIANGLYHLPHPSLMKLEHESSVNHIADTTSKSPEMDDDESKKDLDHIVPNAKTTTTTQSNGATTTKQNMTTPTCKNCKTQTTPLWRRDETGQVLCNACGLFLKLHGRPRPISLKSDVIKSRNRVKHSSKSSPNTPELKAKDSSSNLAGNGIASGNISTANNAPNVSNGATGTNGGKIATKFLPKQYKPNTKAKGKKATKAQQQQQQQQPPPPQQSINQVVLTQLPPLPQPISSSKAGSFGSKLTKPHSDENGQPTFMNNLNSPSLLPLLPRNGQQGQNLPPGTPYTYASNNAWMSKSQGQTIQSLHYPSSTPAQYVSDLNRITSPLLLSTATPPKLNHTPSQSQSSERSSSLNGNLNRDAVLNAAGALEILSQQANNAAQAQAQAQTQTQSQTQTPQTSASQALGNDHIPGMRLNSPHGTPLSNPVSSSGVEKLPPISLLQSKETLEARKSMIKNEPTQLHNILTGNGNVNGTITEGLNTNGNSKGTNIHNENPIFNQLRNSHNGTTLPPISSPLLAAQGQMQGVIPAPSQLSVASQLPPIKNLPGISYMMYNGQSRGESKPSEINGKVDGNTISHFQEENEKLRTRINELELVNELYKTRLVELEQTDAKRNNQMCELRNQVVELEQALRLLSQQQQHQMPQQKRQAETETPSEESLSKRIKVET